MDKDSFVWAREDAVAAGGPSAAGTGLHGLGVPEDSMVRYETGLTSDTPVLTARGSVDETARAKGTINGTEPATLDHRP